MGRKFIVGGNWKAVRRGLAGCRQGRGVGRGQGEGNAAAKKKNRRVLAALPLAHLSSPLSPTQNGTKASIDTLLAEFAKADVPADVGACGKGGGRAGKRAGGVGRTRERPQGVVCRLGVRRQQEARLRRPRPPAPIPHSDRTSGCMHVLATRTTLVGVAGGKPDARAPRRPKKKKRAGAMPAHAGGAPALRCQFQPHPPPSLIPLLPPLPSLSARGRHRAHPPPPVRRGVRPAPGLGGRRPKRVAQGPRRLHGGGPPPGPG